MNLTLKVWRQQSTKAPGKFVTYQVKEVTPDMSFLEMLDAFNEDLLSKGEPHCGRVNAPAGVIRFLNDAIIRDPGELDAYAPEAPQLDVRETPVETLSFLTSSRYCDGDTELLDFAWRMFGQTPTGWPRVQAICDFVHAHLRFDYQAGSR